MKTKYHILALYYSKRNDMYSPYICYYDKGKLETYTLPIEELCVLSSQKGLIEIMMNIYTKNSYFVKNPRVSFLCSMPKRYTS